MNFKNWLVENGYVREDDSSTVSHEVEFPMHDLSNIRDLLVDQLSGLRPPEDFYITPRNTLRIRLPTPEKLELFGIQSEYATSSKKYSMMRDPHAYSEFQPPKRFVRKQLMKNRQKISSFLSAIEDQSIAQKCKRHFAKLEEEYGIELEIPQFQLEFPFASSTPTLYKNTRYGCKENKRYTTPKVENLELIFE